MLEKTQVVMKTRKTAKSLPPHLVAFETVQDDPGDTDHRLKVDRRTYVDMGEPSMVTVTIEPGDKLND